MTLNPTITLDKQNASLHLATVPLNPDCDFPLHLLKVDPATNTVQAINGVSLYESKMPDVPQLTNRSTEPIYVSGGAVKRISRSVTAKQPYINITSNSATRNMTLRTGATQLCVDDPNNPDNPDNPVTWPDVDPIIAQGAESKEPPVILSLTELERVVTAYQQHHVKQVRVLVDSSVTHAKFLSESDAGKTLTVYLMSCN